MTIEETRSADLREKMLRDGYVVVPGLFDRQEIAEFRRETARHFHKGRGTVGNLGRTQPNASIEVPGLANIFAHPKVTETFRALFGTPAAVFTGQSDAHSNTISGFHRDTGGPTHYYFDQDCFGDDCLVYKMGVYLQDHEDGDGLTVRPGSHREPGVPSRPPISLSSKAGDAIVFDVRIVHRGRAANRIEGLVHTTSRKLTGALRILKLRPRSKGELKLGYALAEMHRRLVKRKPRLAVFFSYGAPNQLTLEFARNNMARQASQYEGASFSYPDALFDRMRETDLSYFDPRSNAIVPAAGGAVSQ